MKIHKKEKEKEKERKNEEDRIQRDILKLYEAFPQTSLVPTQKAAKSHWLHPQQAITIVRLEVDI